jgi:hypothetical protein
LKLPILANTVGSNPVNNEVSADLNAGVVVDSVVLYTGVPDGGKDICQGDPSGSKELRLEW